ncbi:MAG: type 1 glutamine amidotransferase [Bacteroidia bacterium]|jgi:type 1 glutamine amidotransferase
MKWLKYTLYAVLVIAVVGGITVYFKLKEIGLIPRAIYETQAPSLPEFTKPAILVLSKANGFIHVDALPAGEAMLKRIAEARGWDIYLTDNAATHNAQDLAKFKVVVWNNVSGDVLTEDQRGALQGYLSGGGGWVGIHASGGDPSYQWDWYVDTLVGAQFVGHTMNPQFQDADVLVTDASLQVTDHLSSPWNIPQEEWYAFDSNPRAKGYEILLTMDESSYLTQGENFFGRDNMDGEHPIAWRHELGEGRVLYNAIGHQGATYVIPEFQQLISNAIDWAGRMESYRIDP